MKKEMTKLLLEYGIISSEEAEKIESINEETIAKTLVKIPGKDPAAL